MESTKLPPELKKNLNRLQDGLKQWSQFVAWSWSNDLAFKKEEQENQEQELKDYFIKILQDQARYSYAVNSYGDDNKKPDAYRASSNIKKLLLGKNDEIEDLKVTLTLPEVYEKLTEQSPECLSDETFMKQFHVEIVTDKFSGSIRDALESEKGDIKKFTGDEDDVLYIIYLTYPPCPAFSKATVTEDQLNNWMRGKKNRDEVATDYLPPSAYIPVSFS